MNTEKLGKNIQKARKDIGLTQAEVAHKAGINVNYYAVIERGEKKATLDTLEKIFKVLKVKPSDVLPFDF